MEPDTQKTIEALGLNGLSGEDQELIMRSLVEAIHKDFLQSLHEKIGDDAFAALDASMKMGDDFYLTTLKHLAPEYEELWQSSRQKILTLFTNGTPSGA